MEYCVGCLVAVAMVAELLCLFEVLEELECRREAAVEVSEMLG